MGVGEIALVVIAVCMVLITIGCMAISFFLYRLLRKLEESVDTVNSQLRPAVIELRNTIKNLTETFRIVNDFVSLTKRFRKKEKK